MCMYDFKIMETESDKRIQIENQNIMATEQFRIQKQISYRSQLCILWVLFSFRRMFTKSKQKLPCHDSFFFFFFCNTKTHTHRKTIKITHAHTYTLSW